MDNSVSIYAQGCDCPRLKDLYDHVVPSVADKWRDIGVHLLDATLVEDRVLEVITANHPHSVEDCCKSMFEKWRNGSWNQLIEVLNIIKLDYIANKLEKSLTDCEQSECHFSSSSGSNARNGPATLECHDMEDLGACEFDVLMFREIKSLELAVIEAFRTTLVKCQPTHLTPSMNYYQDYLKYKYDSLELVSPDEMLDCFSSQYIDLILIKDNKSKPIRGTRSIADGKNVGVEVKQDGDSEYVTLSEALDVEKEKKKIITIEGGPGMGKTTLAINICKCWAKNELLQSYNAVVLLTLRDPEIQEAKTIGDLLLIPSDKMRDNVLEDIMKIHGEGICFILEGFDELPYHLQNSSLFTKITEKLSRCMVIYTSRPYSLSYSIKASQTIKINGFMEKSVDEYIAKTFENELDGDKMALELQSQIHNNPEVKKILNVPINVAIICLIFFYYLKLPDKITELYTLLCLRLILRHINKRTPNVEQIKVLTSLNDLPEEVSKEFSCLCYIAYKGICGKKIIFSSNDLHDMGISRDVNGLGLLLIAPSTSIYGIKKSYNFLHLTLQEFCAAWHLSKLSVEEQTERLSFFLYSILARDNLDGINSNIVWRFYSGITHLTEVNLEKLILPHEFGLNKKLFKLIELLYEADNYSLCQKVGNCFNGDLDLCYYHLGSDYNIYSLRYFLKHFQGNVELITFGSSHSSDDTNRKIFDIIVNSLLLSSLNNNDLGFKILLSEISLQSFFSLAIFLIAHKHLIVELYFEEFHKKYLSFLPQIVCSNEVLMILCIKFSKSFYFFDEIVCEGADWLESCKKLHLLHLGLSRCKLDTEKIGKMLSLNNSILHIDLSYNDIDDDGVEVLANYLKHNCTLESLDLRGNNITPIGAVCLREIINNLQCIKLSYNPLGHVGIYLILESITDSMEHIDLCIRGTSYSYKSIAGILDKVKSIDFILPDGDHEDCKMLYEGLANTKTIEKLEVSGVNDLNHHSFLNAIEQNYNISTLEINYENFTYEFGVHLAEFIKNNKFLSALLLRYSPMLLFEELLLIADSLAENSSIKRLNIGYLAAVRADYVLEFFEKLEHADTLKWLSLHIHVLCGFTSYSETDVYKEVDVFVQQINQNRSIRGLDPLELNFNGF